MLTAQTTHKYSITGICQSRLITRNYSQTSTNYFLGVKGAKAERIVITESVRLEVSPIYVSVSCYFFVLSFFLLNLIEFQGKALPVCFLLNVILNQIVSLTELRKKCCLKELECPSRSNWIISNAILDAGCLK